MICPACHGSEWRARPGRMERCTVCAPPPLTCRGVACLDAWKCNVAQACSLPEREPERPSVELRVGESVRVRAPVHETTFRVERDGNHLVIWRTA